jgi:KDO2-lipid IV(A) lauroyltransferase
MNAQNKRDDNSDLAKLTSGQKLQLKLMLLTARGLRLLGYNGLCRLASFCAFCFWHLAASRRRYAIAAVEQHLGKSRAEAKKIARASFRHNFQSFLEIVLAENFGLRDNPRLTKISPIFVQMEKKERPVVGITGHLGAWELLAGGLAGLRTTRPGVLVVRYPQNKAMRVFMRLMRTHGNCRSVGHRNATTEVTAALRQNGTAAFLADHNTNRHEAIFLPFLGEMAAVNLGPALLALRGKAIIYPGYLKRLPGNFYELRALPPLDTATLEGSIAERSRIIAEFYTKALEQFVIEAPEQWFWMHKRWKTQPK